MTQSAGSQQLASSSLNTSGYTLTINWPLLSGIVMFYCCTCRFDVRNFNNIPVKSAEKISKSYPAHPSKSLFVTSQRDDFCAKQKEEREDGLVFQPGWTLRKTGPLKSQSLFLKTRPCTKDTSQPVSQSEAIHLSGPVISLPYPLWRGRPPAYWSKLHFRINRDFPLGGRKQCGHRLATGSKREADKYLAVHDAGGQEGGNPVNTVCVPDQQVDDCQDSIFKKIKNKNPTGNLVEEASQPHFLIYIKLSWNKLSPRPEWNILQQLQENWWMMDGVSFIHDLKLVNNAKKQIF